MNDKNTNASFQSTQKRLREILAVLTKNGIVKGITPEKLRLIIDDLGPTFVKIGQVMSMRHDMLPSAYCEELTKLRSEVKPIPFLEVKSVIEQEYKTLLEDVFSQFDEEPIGSASIAQVHTACLKDGRSVVVKVQRPGIYERMAQDIMLLRKAASILKIAHVTNDVVDFSMILNEMWVAAQQEMDFLIEARHMEEFYAYNHEIRYIACPQVEHQYTTSKVLVMEYIEGAAIDDTETLLKNGYDLTEIGTKLSENYVKQIVDDGYFHADPHPGNIRIRDGKIVWLDWGMAGRLSKRDKTLLQNSVTAVVGHDVNELKNILLMMGDCKGPIDHIRLYAELDDLLTKYGTLDMGSVNLGKVIEDMMEVANNHQIRVPGGIAMLGRGLITFEGVLSVVSPDISMLDIMANHMRSEILKNFDFQKELEEGGRTLYESGRKALDIPSQIFDVLKMTIRGQTKFNLDLTAQQPITSINKMVNRLIVCIISAAFLLGSSLICTTDMAPKILGIPALGFIGYFAAMISGGWLVWSILKK